MGLAAHYHGAGTAGSPLHLVPLDTRFSRFIHVFRYDGSALRALIRKGEFDIVHAWEEPYVFAGYQIAKAAERQPSEILFSHRPELR